ncbi:MAG: polysaccharide deacetylase family protein [Anaerolineales bacterium]
MAHARRLANFVGHQSSDLKPLRVTSWLLAMTVFLLLGCGGFGLIATPTPTLPIEPTRTVSASLTPFQPAPATSTLIPTETFTPSPTFTPTSTFTPLPTSTPTVTPTPEFIFQGPGNVTIPILLYHHIGYSLTDSEYYVSPDEFANQMNYLFMHGYRTITVEQLTQAIYFGAQLPSRPVLLTFDDGSETVYTEALPVMQTYGFTGTAYIVYNYIGSTRYMDKNQIRALYDAGWEIGSHGISHLDLTTRPGKQEDEVVSSRRRLESYLGVPIRSFAYPFGVYDDTSLHFVKSAGYTSAMGLGDKSTQGMGNIFYLYRQSIMAETTLEAFADLLPWKP